MDLAVAFFTNTKGHFGNQHLWKKTWNSFYHNIFSYTNIKPIINVVLDDKGDDVLKDMIDFFSIYNIRDIHIRKANWKHHDPSFHTGYATDFLNVYSKVIELDCDFCLHLEDDWIIDPKSYDHENILAFNEALDYIKNNKSCLQIKFCREDDERGRILNLPENLSWKKKINDRTNKIFETSDLFSFNPHINRPRDIFLAINKAISCWSSESLLQQNFEMGFTELIRDMTNSETPFAVMKKEYLPIEHIGVPDE